MRSVLSRRRFISSMAGAGASLALAAKPLQAAARKPMPDVIVLLPGIGGSVLRRGDQDVWALSQQGLMGALLTLGRSLDSLKLTQDPPDVADLGDGVTADRLFDDVHLLPGLWKIDGYSKIRQRLLLEFDVQPGVNFIEFPYDWRRDNRVAARRLEKLSHVWLKTWRARSGNRDAKLVLLAHSMGGLVARYYLECLGGWKDARKLITFGTPYRGSLNALNFLCNGFSRRLAGVELADLSPLLRSFTSVYQLLPRYPCYDPGDGKPVRVADTIGIPNVDAPRAGNALAFQHEIDDAIQRNLKDQSYLDHRYQTHPVAGLYQSTLQYARLKGGRVELSASFPDPNDSAADGDGTVPRVSATPLATEHANAPMFVAQVHGSLQNTDAVLVQVAGLLTAERNDEKRFRGGLGAQISLSLQDLYSEAEPVPISGQCDDPRQKLVAIVSDSTTGAEVARRPLPLDDKQAYSAVLAPLPAGSYRVTVSGPEATPVTDVFLVAAKGQL